MPSASAEAERLRLELKRKQELFDTLMEASYDGLCLIAADGTFLEMNAAFERITGLKRQDWIGRTLEQMRTAPGITRNSAALQVLSGSYPATTLVNIRGGEMILVTASPHFNEQGELLNIILNVRNITQLNYLKYQLEQRRGQAKLSEMEELSSAYLRDKIRSAGLGEFVINSPLMAKVVSTVVQIADFDFTVLLEGETGVGKGVMAQLIHRLSRRAPQPFVEVNCAAIPENLVESELFGYEAGAFTGSLRTGKKGYFEAASGGTIFLDEVSELPRAVQAKLLKVLDNKLVTRLGSTTPQRLDVRVIAATNQNLRELVKQGLFRADLLYRLEFVPIFIPPLRERREDIKALAYLFLEQFNREFGMDKVLASETLARLGQADLGGNVRELKNLLARLVLACEEKEIQPRHLLAELERRAEPIAAAGPNTVREPSAAPDDSRPIKARMEDAERDILTRCVAECKSTYEIAARLGMNQSSVVRKLKKYGLRCANRR
ncbi:MAG: sigma 54-interacting transcriptional regulator [Deltaproteobacteria bacterium]|nr:sigma 54-interacting transcriptional regulator [Deltaproteobacteria bacterium]